MAAPLPLAGMDRWSTINPRHIAGHLREYDLREPLHADGSQILGFDSLAIPVMNSTPVPGYTTQLCNTGLPFRINVIVWPEFFTVDDEVIIPTFQLPPFIVVPTDNDGINSWPTFLSMLRQSIEYKISNIEGLPSDVSFHGLVGLMFLFVPMDNLARSMCICPPLLTAARRSSPRSSTISTAA